MVHQDLAGDDAFRARTRLAFESKIAQLLAKDDAQSARAAMELARGLNSMLGIQRPEQQSTSIADFTQKALEALSRKGPKKAAEPHGIRISDSVDQEPTEASLSETAAEFTESSEATVTKRDPIKALVEHFDARNGNSRTLAH